MRSRSVVKRTLLLSLASLVSFGVVVVASACYRPDVAALTVKMQEECRLAPESPPCALEDPEARDYIYERWLLDEIDGPAEEECLREADCGDPPGSDGVEVVRRCSRIDDSWLEAIEPDPDQDCALACSQELWSCGGEEACGVDVAKRCLDDKDACVAACPAR